MIDMTGIKPFFDVTVKKTSGSIELGFTVASFSDKIKQSVFSLEKTGFSVHHSYPQGIEIFARDLFDSQQVAEVAERLSVYFEGKGLKVSRLIPNLGSGSLWKPVQSFK